MGWRATREMCVECVDGEEEEERSRGRFLYPQDGEKKQRLCCSGQRIICSSGRSILVLHILATALPSRLRCRYSPRRATTSRVGTFNLFLPLDPLFVRLGTHRPG